ncbi:MAG: PAS domain-containing protein [Gammaproteobacteria bacterium]|nr:PAS domain-containing protein [Gammaproteobacteria bacterium]MBA3731291.1 PAS domain-containing protein [Gammaproteobacteria bacterium]
MDESSALSLGLLLIAETPADADWLRQHIADWPSSRPLLEHVADTQSACARLAANDVDVVILVLHDASPTDLEVRLKPVARLRKANAGITVLVLTDFEPDEHAAARILQSANDYLVKHQLSPWSLTRSIRVAGKYHGLQRQLLDVLGASPDGMIVVDEDGRVLYVNQAGARMFGRVPSDLQGELFGYPVAGADRTELDIGTEHTAEMRVVDVEWSGDRAHRSRCAT